MLTGVAIKNELKLLKEDEYTEKGIILDELDDADRVLLWENDLQFKKVRKSHYMISRYPTYHNIVIILYRDVGIVIISCRVTSGNSFP